MAGGRVTPRRRKPLRATMKGPPPRVRDRTPCCNRPSLDQIDWIEGVPVACCRMCRTILTRSHKGRFAIASATGQPMRLAPLEPPGLAAAAE